VRSPTTIDQDQQQQPQTNYSYRQDAFSPVRKQAGKSTADSVGGMSTTAATKEGGMGGRAGMLGYVATDARRGGPGGGAQPLLAKRLDFYSGNVANS